MKALKIGLNNHNSLFSIDDEGFLKISIWENEEKTKMKEFSKFKVSENELMCFTELQSSLIACGDKDGVVKIVDYSRAEKDHIIETIKFIDNTWVKAI